MHAQGSKEYTPAMAKAVYDNMMTDSPKQNFSVGVNDDVTGRSLDIGPAYVVTDGEATTQCVFWGVGGDGTVGANQDAIHMIGEATGMQTQAYFQYDSKKSLGVTRSHLRFGEDKITSQYLVLPEQADYVACHHPSYIGKYDVLQYSKDGTAFVLNSPWTVEEMETKLPDTLKRSLAEKNMEFYNIDASAVAEAAGLPKRINVVMQAAFFKLSEVIPVEEALDLYSESIKTR